MAGNLKPGQAVSATHHRCQQTACAFFRRGGCQSCEECRAGPYEMTNACDRCQSCEGDEGELRWGSSKGGVKVRQQEKDVEARV
jgi:hypothetical protein